MIRARFFQDVYLVDYDLVVREHNEHDLDIDTALDLYDKGLVDLLNPYENDDLSANIESYEKDWGIFKKYKRRRWIND